MYVRSCDRALACVCVSIRARTCAYLMRKFNGGLRATIGVRYKFYFFIRLHCRLITCLQFYAKGFLLFWQLTNVEKCGVNGTLSSLYIFWHCRCMCMTVLRSCFLAHSHGYLSCMPSFTLLNEQCLLDDKIKTCPCLWPTFFHCQNKGERAMWHGCILTV